MAVRKHPAAKKTAAKKMGKPNISKKDQGIICNTINEAAKNVSDFMVWNMVLSELGKIKRLLDPPKPGGVPFPKGGPDPVASPTGKYQATAEDIKVVNDIKIHVVGTDDMPRNIKDTETDILQILRLFPQGQRNQILAGVILEMDVDSRETLSKVNEASKIAQENSNMANLQRKEFVDLVQKIVVY